MQQKNHELPISDHFDLHQLAEGVYAAIAIEGGAATSNAGIIDLGDQTLIFDTFETPMAAQDLRAAAERLTGRPASCVIISHVHDDHWMGNQVFVDHTPIIATHQTRAEMSIPADDSSEMQEIQAEFEEMIKEQEERLRTETDDRWRKSLQSSIRRYRYALEMQPILELRFPNQTFDGKIIFHGTRRMAELLTLGGGHTASDCFLVLPAEKIVFMGDLAFFQCQPFMAYSEPKALMEQLKDMEQSDFEIFVPGHGPLGTKADITLQMRYISFLEEMVGHIVKEGGTVEEALKQSLPEPFDAWLSGGMARFEANVQFYYDRLSGD
jgi:glyoxylase-like metal-dependent hydrolase (beta-lactamase superfamily II)